MNIDSILTEWCYRLPNGYPTKKQDYQILRNILLEAGADPQVADTIIQQSQDPTNVGSIQDRIKEIGLPDQLNKVCLTIYNALSESEKQQFDKNFRTHTVESYVAGGYIPFIKFFPVVLEQKARGGMGRGEVQTLLALKDATPGGTERHDIILPGIEWELKETKGGKFDPAKAGIAVKFELTKLLQNFYDTIVYPMAELGDPYDVLKDLVDPVALDPLKKLVHIIEHNFEDSIDSDKFLTYEWKKSAWVNWYSGFKQLHEIFYKTKLDTSVRDTRLTINKDTETSSYWVSDDDAEKIELGAGESNPTSIMIGTNVNSTNKNIVIWFKQIERNIFVKNPNQFITQLNIIKRSFFDEAGLIWYATENPAIPHIGLPENFAIDSLSQGRYRFVYKDASAARGIDYLQDQS